MLVATIKVFDKQSTLQKIQEAILQPIDAIELRFDFYTSQLDIEICELLGELKKFTTPMIFTLRKKSQGGNFNDNEIKRQQLIEQLASGNPAYLDLEYDIPHVFIKKIHQDNPAIKLICSYHDFAKTPDDLNALLESLKKPEFSIYKIATFANSTLDTMRVLAFVKNQSRIIKICGIAMGEYGMPTRILAPILQSAMNYVTLKKSEETAPGQLDLKTLLEIYHYKTLNPETKIYALIGNPIIHSIGHIFHNQKFQELKQNAIYLKIVLQSDELKNFFEITKILPFHGFSVTMPFKEKAIEHLDALDASAEKIQAVNTIILKGGKLIGSNTDGVGALNVIEGKITVKNKRIIILGAGGTAKAIAYEAKIKGAQVVIVNRTKERAQNVAKQIGCEYYDIEKILDLSKIGYDILINTTSLGMAGQPQTLPIPAKAILPNTVILEMVNAPSDTSFLSDARAKNCTCLTGKMAFDEQARLQEKIWFFYN